MGIKVTFLFTLAFATAIGGELPALENPVKAAFLYNLARFVQWPAASGVPIVLGVLDRGPFDATLRQLVEGKSLDGRPLTVRRISKVEDARLCQLIFIDESESDRLGDLLSAVKGAEVLTVSTMERFAERGGMISLLGESRNIRFEANIDKLSSAGIKISARFLQLAVIVRNRDREGRR